MNALFAVLIFLGEIQALMAFSKTIEAVYPSKLLGLSIRGSGCGLNWDSGFSMSSVSSSEGYKWSYTVNCTSSEDALEVKVLVSDKTWMLGSNHHISGTALQSSSADTIYPFFYTYEGTQTIIKNVYSEELKNVRDVIVYLPPSYNENTLKVHKNVLIMHDGQNLFDPRTSAFGTAWMCQDALNGNIINGVSDEVVIVGAYNTNDRNNEYTYIYDPEEGFGGKGDLYLDWIESTLIPLAAKTYRVDIQRDTLGIMGSSLGGLISCYAGWTRSTYGKVGCMSSSFWWDEKDYQTNVMPNNVPSTPLPVFYMDSGNGSEGEKECTLYTSQIYSYQQKVGFTENVNLFKYVAEGGTHDEASWAERVWIPFKDLYPASTV